MSSWPPVREDLIELAGYHSPQLDVDIRLNTNESPEPPPVEFSREVARRIESLAWNRYPDRRADELRDALAHHQSRMLSGPTGRLSKDQLFVSNGSNEVFQTLLLTFGGPGRKVVTFEPTYAMHSQISHITGTDVVRVERDADFGLDLEKARETLSRERPVITFLCLPNNPTGLSEDLAVVEDLITVTSEFGFVVVDEAYGEFSRRSALHLLGEHRNLIVTRTLSKTWAMAGARVGYLVGPENVVERLWAVTLPYHLSALAQTAGLVALDYEAEMADRVARLIQNRDTIEAGLDQMGIQYWPSQSNFVLFRPPPGCAPRYWQALVEKGILVRDCSTWPLLQGCLRVTVGTHAECAKFLAALNAIA